MRIVLSVLIGLLVFGFSEGETVRIHPGIQDTQVWNVYSENPVFVPDAPLYYAVFPCVLYDSDRFGGKDGSFYKMWFDTVEGLHYIDSKDGIKWEKLKPAKQGLRNAFQGKVIYDKNCFDDGLYAYRIYYAQADKAPRGPLRTAKSRDGINWEEDTTVTGIYIENHPWSQRGYGVVTVLYHFDGLEKINVEQPLKNRYVMFYECFVLTGKGMCEIALAVSANGKDFEIVGDGPVIRCGGRGTDSWDRDYATFGSVLACDDGLLRAWYSGGKDENADLLFSGIGFAISKDGIHWEKSPHNPVLKWKERSWDFGACSMPQVIFDRDCFRATGDKKGSSYKMWYCGSVNDKFFKPEWRAGIGLAWLN